MARADHFVAVLMVSLACVFPLLELALQDLPDQNALMRVGACGGILYPFSRHVHDFVYGIKMQDLVEVT